LNSLYPFCDHPFGVKNGKGDQVMLIASVLWFALSVIVGILGRDRKIGFLGFFFLSLVLSPLLVLVALLLTVPDSSEAA
jgi:hypothetical protein